MTAAWPRRWSARAPIFARELGLCRHKANFAAVAIETVGAFEVGQLKEGPEVRSDLAGKKEIDLLRKLDAGILRIGLALVCIRHGSLDVHRERQIIQDRKRGGFGVPFFSNDLVLSGRREGVELEIPTRRGEFREGQMACAAGQACLTRKTGKRVQVGRNKEGGGTRDRDPPGRTGRVPRGTGW